MLLSNRSITLHIVLIFVCSVASVFFGIVAGDRADAGPEHETARVVYTGLSFVLCIIVAPILTISLLDKLWYSRHEDA